ncbi:hypothetical protein DFP73DRAFT_589031 [Morchella snyderi]|nr:hypothetical protein DFP73DRAFT_589031 [Morchella snyderi]
MPLLALPNEIIAEIVDFGAINPPPLPDLVLDTRPRNHIDIRTLASLCLVSKRLYAHASARLYSHVVTDDFASSALLDTLGDPRIAGLVRTLSVYDYRPIAWDQHIQDDWTEKELEGWAKLERAIVHMANVERLEYEDNGTLRPAMYAATPPAIRPAISAAIRAMSKLRHLKTSNADVLLPGPMPALTSLDVYWIDSELTQVTSLTALLTASAATLKSLTLCLAAVSRPSQLHLVDILTALPQRLKLEQLTLDIPALTQPIATALSKALDLSRVRVLDLWSLGVQNRRLQVARPSGGNGQEMLLKELVGNAAPKCLYVHGPADIFVASYRGLEELSCQTEIFDVRVLARHGDTLARLCLAGMQGLTAEEVCGLVEACPNIEELKMPVLDGNFESLSASLATMRKLHTLSLTIWARADLSLPPSNYRPPGGQLLPPPWRPRGEIFGLQAIQEERGTVLQYAPLNLHWLYNTVSTTPDPQNGLDAALGLLLVAGVAAPRIELGGYVGTPRIGLGGYGERYFKRAWVREGTVRRRHAQTDLDLPQEIITRIHHGFADQTSACRVIVHLENLPTARFTCKLYFDSSRIRQRGG